MWSREAYKERAKKVLTNSYWFGFLVCLLVSIITGVSSRINFSNNDRLDFRNFFSGYNIYNGNDFNYFHSISSYFLGFIGILSLVLFSVRIVYTFFVTNVFEVGKSRFFLSSRRGEKDFVTLFNAFKKDNYLNVVKSMAWRALFTFLWTLLFIIPGIVKAYSYSMVPYILADNPNIGYDRALKLSMDMTRGYKADIFILQLSFIGWYLLGIVACCIGVLFVNPYYEATVAEAYGFLRKNAIAKGYCTPYELNLSQTDYVADSQLP